MGMQRAGQEREGALREGSCILPVSWMWVLERAAPEQPLPQPLCRAVCIWGKQGDKSSYADLWAQPPRNKVVIA